MLNINEIQRYSKRDVFRFLSLQTCVEKILFRLISFKKNNPNHITAKEKIQERFHGKKNKIFHVQKYKLVDFLNGDMQIAVNTHGTIRS